MPAPPTASGPLQPRGSPTPSLSKPQATLLLPLHPRTHPTRCISGSDSYAGLMGARNIWVCTCVMKNQKPAWIHNAARRARGGMSRTPTRNPPPLRGDVTNMVLGNQQNPETSSQEEMGKITVRHTQNQP